MGIKIHTALIRTRNPGSALVEQAERVGAEVIYWSTIHAPAGEQRIGPTAAYLLAKRPCRIIIETENQKEPRARGGPGPGLRAIIMGAMGSRTAPSSPPALRAPVALARGAGLARDRRALDAARLPAQARRAGRDARRRLPAAGARDLDLLGAVLRARDGGPQRRRRSTSSTCRRPATSRSATVATGSAWRRSRRSRSSSGSSPSSRVRARGSSTSAAVRPRWRASSRSCCSAPSDWRCARAGGGAAGAGARHALGGDPARRCDGVARRGRAAAARGRRDDRRAGAPRGRLGRRARASARAGRAGAVLDPRGGSPPREPARGDRRDGSAAPQRRDEDGRAALGLPRPAHARHGDPHRGRARSTRSEPEVENVAEVRELVLDAGTRLWLLIEKLLDLSLLQSGSMEPALTWCSLEEVLDEAVESTGAPPASFQLSIERELPPLAGRRRAARARVRERARERRALLRGQPGLRAGAVGGGARARTDRRPRARDRARRAGAGLPAVLPRGGATRPPRLRARAGDRQGLHRGQRRADRDREPARSGHELRDRLPDRRAQRSRPRRPASPRRSADGGDDRRADPRLRRRPADPARAAARAARGGLRGDRHRPPARRRSTGRRCSDRTPRSST